MVCTRAAGVKTGWSCTQARFAQHTPQLPAHVAVHHGVAGEGARLDAQGDAGTGAALCLRQLQRVGAVAGLVPGGPGAVGLQLVLGQRHDLRAAGWQRCGEPCCCACTNLRYVPAAVRCPHPPPAPLQPTVMVPECRCRGCRKRPVKLVHWMTAGRVDRAVVQPGGEQR